MNLRVRGYGSVTQLNGAGWDALDHGGSPFLRHGFLAALEASGSIDAVQGPRNLQRRGSGWTGIYLVAELAGRVVGGVAAYLKTHSYGEYIFDWSWANAAQRSGLEYYPKLVIAAPMTPATGPRILLAPDLGDARDPVRAALIEGVRGIAEDTQCSSIHWLFCTAEEQAALAQAGFFPRASLQFHWRNRDYGSFADFLGALKSRKRKQLRKEREKARAAIDSLSWIAGRDLDPARLDDLDRFYRTTTEEHGGRDYLRPGFFHELAQTMPDELQMVEVVVGGKRVAGAVFFETDRALYGRYWGADAHVDLLHFETAYYAGIDRAIERKLPLFEAGAQGEHKLLRGFEPSPTYSAHWIRHPGLAAAIEDFAQREALGVAHEIAEMAKFGPYRNADDDAAGGDAGVDAE
ncbi:MAG: GNAT family N-acetyltransferase [Deltaproteobacteria bacterium]|nr:GNAT family N-acetyltransferase [Deltaproteobacteria bacterium]